MSNMKKRKYHHRTSNRLGNQKKGFLVLAILLILSAVIFVGTTMLDRLRIIEDDSWEDDIGGFLTIDDVDYIYKHHFETYLLLGTDNSGNPNAKGSDYQGSMADFLALLVFDKTEKTYSIIELNRDTMTDIVLLDKKDEDLEERTMQLCTAHWYGSSKEVGCENTVDAVSRMLGALDIDGYYELPMDQIPRLNQAVGGVTVTIEDDFSNTDPSLIKGQSIKLTDEQARHFVHDRMDVGDGSNEGRMRRQMQFMRAFAEEAKVKSNEDKQFAVKVYEEFRDIATSDINGNKISKIINRLMTYEQKGLYEFEGTTVLGKSLGDNVEHAEFTPDPASVIKVLTEVYVLEKDED